MDNPAQTDWDVMDDSGHLYILLILSVFNWSPNNASIRQWIIIDFIRLGLPVITFSGVFFLA